MFKSNQRASTTIVLGHGTHGKFQSIKNVAIVSFTGPGESVMALATIKWIFLWYLHSNIEVTVNVCSPKIHVYSTEAQVIWWKFYEIDRINSVFNWVIITCTPVLELLPFPACQWEYSGLSCLYCSVLGMNVRVLLLLL